MRPSSPAISLVRTRSALGKRAHALTDAVVINGITADSVGMDFPLLPFTFPTAMFCEHARALGFGISWNDCGKLLGAYEDGRENGSIPKGGNTPQAAAYMAKATGLSEKLASQWLQTADSAVNEWWGDGYVFPDFGGSTLIDGVVKSVTTVTNKAAESVGKVVGGAVNKLADGVSKGLGVPKFVWIGAGLVVLILVGMVVLKVKKKGV